MASQREKLPDLLAPNLKIVFCGTAASEKSAQVGAYYANPTNKFWRVLHEVGLTSQRLQPPQFAELLHYGIGLTDLAKFSAGMDKALKRADFDAVQFRAKIITLKPKVVAFTSKKAGQVFYGTSKIAFGRQPEMFEETVVFVLPSPSGAANRSWDITHWQALAEFVK